MSMTDKEEELLEHLADAWRMFRELPVQHTKEKERFYSAILNAQGIVLARSTVRECESVVEIGKSG